jgi:hypothetical protein
LDDRGVLRFLCYRPVNMQTSPFLKLDQMQSIYALESPLFDLQPRVPISARMNSLRAQIGPYGRNTPGGARLNLGPVRRPKTASFHYPKVKCRCNLEIKKNPNPLVRCFWKFLIRHEFEQLNLRNGSRPCFVQSPIGFSFLRHPQGQAASV